MSKFITSLLLLGLFLASCEKETPFVDQSPSYETIGQVTVQQVLNGQAPASIAAAATFNQPNSTTHMINVGQVTYNGNATNLKVDQGSTLYQRIYQAAPVSGHVVWEVEGNANFPAFTYTTTQEMPYFELDVPQTTLAPTDQLVLNFEAHRGVEYISLHIGTTTARLEPIIIEQASGLQQYTLPVSRIAAVCPTNTPITLEVQAYNHEFTLVDNKKITSSLGSKRVAFLTITP